MSDFEHAALRVAMYFLGTIFGFVGGLMVMEIGYIALAFPVLMIFAVRLWRPDR
jgi:hypothetical protein